MDPLRPDVSRVLIEALSALGPGGHSRRAADTEAAAKGAKTLRERLVEVMVGIDLENDAALAEMRLPILHCILSERWGGDLVSDPLYAEVLGAVDRDIRENRELDALFRRAMASLTPGP